MIIDDITLKTRKTLRSITLCKRAIYTEQEFDYEIHNVDLIILLLKKKLQ